MCSFIITDNIVVEDKASILKKYNDINKNEIVDTVLSQIQKRYMADLSLVDMADTVHVHPIYLSRLISSNIKKPFIRVLNEYRLGKAAWYLATTDKQAREISAMVGYQDARYFGLLFKKNYGSTPLDYRNRIKGCLR